MVASFCLSLSLRCSCNRYSVTAAVWVAVWLEQYRLTSLLCPRHVCVKKPAYQTAGAGPPQNAHCRQTLSLTGSHHSHVSVAVQAFALAPLFVWFEALFLIGFRPKLHQELREAVDREIERAAKEK